MFHHPCSLSTTTICCQYHATKVLTFREIRNVSAYWFRYSDTKKASNSTTSTTTLTLSYFFCILSAFLLFIIFVFFSIRLYYYATKVQRPCYQNITTILRYCYVSQKGSHYSVNLLFLQSKDYGQPSARRYLRMHSAMVGKHRIFHDSEPQSRAAQLT